MPPSCPEALSSIAHLSKGASQMAMENVNQPIKEELAAVAAMDLISSGNVLHPGSHGLATQACRGHRSATMGSDVLRKKLLEVEDAISCPARDIVEHVEVGFATFNLHNVHAKISKLCDRKLEKLRKCARAGAGVCALISVCDSVMSICNDNNENVSKLHTCVLCLNHLGAQVIQNSTTRGLWSIKEFIVLRRVETHFSSTFVQGKTKQIQLPQTLIQQTQEDKRMHTFKLINGTSSVTHKPH